VLILGIESSTAQVGCAIGGHEGVLASAHSARGRRHAESLAPQIDFVRRQARIELSEISVVAVDLGPGLYTGLRVGIATAMSMAYALGVPMIGVSSLDLVAFRARWSPRLIVVALDARRSEVFTATYRHVPGGIQQMSEPRGDGALRYRDEFEGNVRIEFADQAAAYPSADALVALAHPRAVREEFVAASELHPLYLRKPDAEVNWTTRASES